VVVANAGFSSAVTIFEHGVVGLSVVDHRGTTPESLTKSPARETTDEIKSQLQSVKSTISG